MRINDENNNKQWHGLVIIVDNFTLWLNDYIKVYIYFIYGVSFDSATMETDHKLNELNVYICTKAYLYVIKAVAWVITYLVVANREIWI